MKIASVNQIELYVLQYETKNNPEEANSGIDWTYIKENYSRVELDSYPGFTQIQKYELFLGHFSTRELIN